MTIRSGAMSESNEPSSEPLSPAGVARREAILRAALAAGRRRRRRTVATRVGAVAAVTVAAGVAVLLGLPDRSTPAPQVVGVRPADRRSESRPVTVPPAVETTKPADRVVISFIATDPALADRAAIRQAGVTWIRLDNDGLLAALSSDGRAGGGLLFRDGRPEVWVPARQPKR